jgi:hypothetical protein
MDILIKTYLLDDQNDKQWTQPTSYFPDQILENSSLIQEVTPNLFTLCNYQLI